MKILLLGHTRRVGKDTFAECLRRIYQPKDATGWRDGRLVCIQTYSFAQKLKHDLLPLCHNMFGKLIADLTDEEKEIFRPILIAYGCAWREIDPEHWVKHVDGKIDAMEFGGYNTHVISDVRFGNESQYFVKKYGRDNVTVIHLEKEGAPEPTEEEKKHEEECAKLTDFNFWWPVLKTDIERDAWVKKFMLDSGLDNWLKNGDIF